jgi:hypothetical protein
MTPDWRQALANETGVSSIGPVSEGPLARAALLVLADDPQHCEVLEALVSGPAPERYSGVIETAAVLSAVLFVLGTHVKLERDKAGQWPELGGDVNFLMWPVPLVLLFLSLYFGSLLAAHKLYERLAKEAEQGPRLLQKQIERQEARLAELESSRVEEARKQSLRLQLDELLGDSLGIVQNLRQHDEQNEFDRIAWEIDGWIATRCPRSSSVT